MRRLANTSRRRRSKKIRRVVSRGLVNTKSLSFDGVNDKAAWAANTTIPNLIGDTDHAWSYWIKKPDFSVDGSGFQSTLIYALFFYGGGLSSFIYGAIGENSHGTSPGKFVCQAVRGASTYWNYSSDSDITSNFNNNDWNHVVISMNDNGTGFDVTVYINGNAIAGTNTSPNSNDFTGINFGDLAIGGVQTFNAGTDVYDVTELDEIALFNTTLSASDVTAIYNSGVPADESARSGLVGYWRLEDNGNDSSSNSNALTITGATFTDDVAS